MVGHESGTTGIETIGPMRAACDGNLLYEQRPLTVDISLVLAERRRLHRHLRFLHASGLLPSYLSERSGL